MFPVSSAMVGSLASFGNGVSPFFNPFDEPPAYFPGQLEVKVRSDQWTPAAAAFGAPTFLTRAAAAASSGMGALLSYERSGLIRRVTALAESAPAAVHTLGETPMLATFAASAVPTVAEDPNANTSIVELHHDADVARLEMELRNDPAIESVSRVPVRYLLAKKRPRTAAPAATPPSSSLTAPLWNLARIRWAEARQRPGFQDANAIKVAVLDTGIDMAHPDLQGAIAKYEHSHPSDPNSTSDRDIIGHGTHVAGTIAARINNAVGINGIATCQIFAYKIFDDGPDWQGQYFAYFVNSVLYQRALSRCISERVNVVNLSIGGRGAPSSNESQLFARLIALGTTVVAAMGNEGSTIPSYPAAIPNVIAVGATSINDALASFSNTGSHIALTAPGVGVWSTLPTYAGNMGYRTRPTVPPSVDFTRPIPRDVDYASWDGTSMASPHVAGAAALYLAKKPTATPSQVKQALQTSAAKVPAMAGLPFTPQFGAGRLDLFSLLS